MTEDETYSVSSNNLSLLASGDIAVVAIPIKWWQFRLRTLVIAVLLLGCAILAIMALRLWRSANLQAAMNELRSSGMVISISGSPLSGHNMVAKLVCQSSTLSDADVERLLALVKILRRDGHSAFSPDLEVVELDLTASNIGDASVERLRHALPEVEIKR
jgi:hypothetical protein